jgi:hypothetical protein
MKISKLKVLGALLLSACMFSSEAFAAAGPTSNTTNEQNQSQITSNVAQVAATANMGMISTRITGLTAPGGFSSGGTGGFGTGGTGGAGGAGGTGGFSRGQSSGNGPEGIGVWALGGSTYLDSSKSGAKYDGSLSNAMVGVDKQIDSLLFGVGFGYENLDLTTKYNSGKMEYDGWSIVPYMSYSITKELVADASFSYTWLNYTMKDTQVGLKYSDSMDANRMVTSVGITDYMSFDKFLLSARLGTLYLNEHQGSYQLKTTQYGDAGVYTWQGNLGVRGTYDLGAFKPFVGVTYMQDFVKSGSNSDMWGTDFDLGFNYSVSDSFQLGLSGTYGIRENLDKVGGMLTIRYDF